LKAKINIMSNKETHAAAKLQLLLLFCLLVFSYYSFSQSKTAAFKYTAVDSGKVFQFITLKDIDGRTIKANDLAGKIVVFNFWFIGCPPCRYEIPMLSEIAEKYKDRNDIVFIAVSEKLS
jgi:thiol-disulfide isomerase/thioredoxin